MKLKKELGFLDVFAIASGAMISSGIFILPGVAFERVGPAVFLAYFLAGLLALTGTFSITELSSAMPKAGGDYFFTTRSLGPMTGTVSGLLSWFALSLKTSFAIIGIAELSHILLGLPMIPTALGACVLFALLNVVGVEKAGKFEVLVVIGLLILMVIFIILGLPETNIQKFDPFIREGKSINSIALTAGFVFVSYGGLLNVATISEEVKNPKKNIPLGMFSSLFVVVTLYCLMLVVTVGTLPAEQLAGSMEPIAAAARQFMGTPGYTMITAAALLAFISTANAGIMAASRYPLALSRDKLLPSWISKTNNRFQSPIYAIILTTFVIGGATLLNLETLVKAASTVVILSYILSHVSVVILRESHIQNYQPSFSAPFYPWLQIIGVICFCLLLIDMGVDIMMISFGLITVGVVFYFAYGRKRANQQYALLQLIARISDKALGEPSYLLESELKQILHNRDEIAFDRFDHLIMEAPVIDLEEKSDYKTLFKVISKKLSAHVQHSGEELETRFLEREKEAGTAITEFTAIPHTMVDGRNVFGLLLVRCREGIYFSDDRPSVKSAFVLYGSSDERLFHLQALAGIAQTIQEEQFQKNWLSAHSPQLLRDVLLLSKRNRINN